MWNTNLVPNYTIAWHFEKPHVWSPITVNQLVLKIFLRGTIASWTYYISLEKPFRVIGNFHPLWNDPKVSLETFPNLTYSKDKEVHLVNFPSVDKENEPDNNAMKDALMAMFLFSETCVHKNHIYPIINYVEYHQDIFHVNSNLIILIFLNKYDYL